MDAFSEIEPDLVWLRMLCVAPDMQHKSIGRQTLAKVMSLSSRLQMRLYLHVFACNRFAHDWYRKLGFVEIESDGRVCMMMFDALSPSGVVGQHG